MDQISKLAQKVFDITNFMALNTSPKIRGQVPHRRHRSLWHPHGTTRAPQSEQTSTFDEDGEPQFGKRLLHFSHSGGSLEGIILGFV